MAVLKDLIVHGRSRFVNGAQFNTINAESIGAEQGIFNKLVATTLDAKEATIDNLTAQNATVVGLLDVQGELHTNAWTNANIANIGGSFYISPTVEPTDGTTTISITRNSATSWTVSASGTFATDFIKSGTATSGVAWPANSLVLITGDVVVGNMVYPLGTLKGTLSAQVTATAATTSKTITITGVTDAQNNNSPSVLQELYELNGNANISNATYKNGKISLYKLGSNPIGILLSSMGTNSNSIIDIYGGVSTNPTVRIGHLAGLPNVNGSAPTGWGIYTDNGYFSGVIVSTSGKIGGFTIGSSDIHNGKTSRTETTNNGVWVGTDGIGLGKGITYFSNDGTGKVGPWTLTTTALYNAKSSYNNANAGIYIGTDYVAGGAGNSWWIKSDGKFQFGGTSGITFDGTTLKVPAANITGTLSASHIDVSGVISTGSIVTDTLTGGTVNTNGFVYVSTKNYGTNVTIGSKTWSDWRLMIGNKFGVDSVGNLVATSAYITGEVTATSGSFTGAIHATSGEFNGQITAGSGTIGRWLITSTALKTNSGSNSAGMGAESTYAFWAGNETPASAPFRVNYNGTLNATGASISGSILATSFTAKDSNNKTRATVDTNGLVLYDGNGYKKASFGSDINLYGGSSTTGAAPYININSTNGITILKDSTHKAIINGDGLSVYAGSSSVPSAIFGSTVQVGATNQNHMNISSDGINIYRQSNHTVIMKPFFNSNSGESLDIRAVADPSLDTFDALDEGYIGIGYGNNGQSYVALQAFNRRDNGSSSGVFVDTDQVDICTTNSNLLFNSHPYIVTEEHSVDNKSIGGSGITNVEVTMTKTNYTLLGTVSIGMANASSSGTNVGNCTIRNFDLSGNTVTVAVYNNKSAAAKIKIMVRGLYRAK